MKSKAQTLRMESEKTHAHGYDIKHGAKTNKRSASRGIVFKQRYRNRRSQLMSPLQRNECEEKDKDPLINRRSMER